MIELYGLYLAVDIDIGNVINAMDKLIDIYILLMSHSFYDCSRLVLV